jgi:hypothetical protein
VATATPTASPVEPIIDPGDLQAAMPSLSDEAALRAVTLASIAVATYLYPCPVPDPLPLPVYSATLQMAIRSGRAGAEGSLTSESIGAYSYHVADPVSAEGALVIPPEIAELLDPYACGPGSSYDVYIGGDYTRRGWPAGWFERDLDNVDAYLDEQAR